MNTKHISYRCPKCGKLLEKSELPDAVELEIIITEPNDEDRRVYDSFNVNLDDYVKVTVRFDENSGYTYMKKTTFERLGAEYIKDHAVISWSEFFKQWNVTVSENDYYNDLSRNPETIIPLEFVKIEPGTGREVYKGIESGRYYLRDVSTRENFAKWLVCGKRRRADDGNPPRANLIFQNGDQTEKVTYNDWNGVCAYSNTFNRNFRSKTTEIT